MRNKLYAFLDKRRTLIKLLIFAAWLCFLLTLENNRPVALAAFMVQFVFMTFALFLAWEQQSRNRVKALQSFMDRRDSSSPQWDGNVRSFYDLEPRLKLLRDRIAQDQDEVDEIELALDTYAPAVKESPADNDP
jgi:hypothetical protein